MENQNKLIAEFMGHKIVGDVPASDGTMMAIYDIETDACKGYAVTGMKYHKEWNWLMPVVEKIESQQAEGYNILIEGTNCWIETQGISFEGMGITKLETTYKAVIEFIKWYNQNN